MYADDVENVNIQNVILNEGSSAIESNVISMEDEEQ